MADRFLPLCRDEHDYIGANGLVVSIFGPSRRLIVRIPCDLVFDDSGAACAWVTRPSQLFFDRGEPALQISRLDRSQLEIQ